ncbi:MAG: hypothetical protein RL329_652, partial [Bacteroidota bacterium]
MGLVGKCVVGKFISRDFWIFFQIFAPFGRASCSSSILISDNSVSITTFGGFQTLQTLYTKRYIPLTINLLVAVDSFISNQFPAIA